MLILGYELTRISERYAMKNMKVILNVCLGVCEKLRTRWTKFIRNEDQLYFNSPEAYRKKVDRFWMLVPIVFVITIFLFIYFGVML